MSMRKILVDDTNRELCPHGTESFPMTVSHDDLWDFEGKSVPIHWHNDLEISLPRKGESIYQIYQKSYHLNPGEALFRPVFFQIGSDGFARHFFEKTAADLSGQMHMICKLL